MMTYPRKKAVPTTGTKFNGKVRTYRTMLSYHALVTDRNGEEWTYGTELGQRLAKEFTELFTFSSSGSNLSSLFNQIGASFL
jgi:hypothetical protein